MTFPQFFVLYILFIVVGSLWITGWFLVTRGKLVVTPTGKVVRSGMLLKGWYFFWNKELFAPEPVYYIGDGLQDLLYKKIQPLLQTLPQFAATAREAGCTSIAINGKELQQLLRVLSRKLGVEIKVLTEESWQNNEVIVEVYVLEKQYLFPAWARKMFSNCVQCFASAYGLLSYSLLLYCAESLFAWCDGSLLMKIVYGILYCLSVCTLNRLLNQNQVYSI